MFEHLEHVLAVAGAAVGGFLLILAGRKGQASPPALPESPPAAPTLSPPPESPEVIHDGLTARGEAELIGHEDIVLEAYKDSQGIWTWGVGVTSASGHKVERYIDNPQPLSVCLQIFIWLLRTKYLPEVLKAFRGHELTETQLAAALSFHYNTGSILHASWVNMWLAGQVDAARVSFMTWKHPAAIVGRRQKECDLFFDGTWSGDGRAEVLPVLKPSYQPDFRHPTSVNISASLHDLLGG